MRKKCRYLSVAFSGLSLLLIAGTAYAADDSIRVSVADAEITPFCLKMRLVRHPNFPMLREKYDLKFQDTIMQMAQTPVTVADHDLDIGECSGISTVINAWNKGAKNIIIFSVGAELPVYQIIARPEIKQIADFKGRNIGTPGINTASTEAVEMILKRGAGLLPNRDYQFVSTGGGSTRAAALIAGRIDALPTFPPISYDMEKRGFPAVADEVTYVPQYVSGVDIVTREWAQAHHDLFIRIIKASVEAGQWLSNPANKDAVIDWFAKNVRVTGGQPIGPELAARMYDFYIVQKRLSFNGYAPEQAIRANLDILKERGFLKDSEVPPLGVVFDFSYLNEALGELGLPKVKEFAKQ